MTDNKVLTENECPRCCRNDFPDRESMIAHFNTCTYNPPLYVKANPVPKTYRIRSNYSGILVQKRNLRRNGGSILIAVPPRFIEANNLKEGDEMLVICSGKTLMVMKENNANSNSNTG